MADTAPLTAHLVDLLDTNAMADQLPGVELAQLPLDLCLFILNTRPSNHYKHLKHILDFESSQLSTPSAIQLDDNLEFQPPNFQSPFLPFSLPDTISTS